MTLIAQGANWWIESFTVTRNNIVAGAERVTAHILERSGVFLGGCVTIDHAVTVANASLLNVTIRNIDNSSLVIGQDLTTFETVVSNGTVNLLGLGEIVLVFMRSRGG